MLNEVSKIPIQSGKSRIAGKSKIFYIAITIIVLSVLFVLFSHIKTCNNPKVETKTETTYTIGKTEQTYKKGRDSIAIESKTFHSTAILKHDLRSLGVGDTSAEDSLYKFTAKDSSYKLSINLKPAEDGNLTFDYFLDLASKTLVRIDTLYQIRVDTLRIKETIIQKVEQPFYNTFIFGAIITGAVMLLIIHFIH